MLSVSAVASLRRGRSAKSTLEPGLSANFKEHKPKAKAKAPAPLVRRKPKLLKWRKLQVECFIDNAWHPATIKDAAARTTSARAIKMALLFARAQHTRHALTRRNRRK